MDVELGQAEGREGVDPAQLQGSAVGESSPLSVTGAVGLVDAGLPLPFTLSSAHSPRTTPTPPPRSSIEQPTLRQPVHRPHRHRLGCHPPIFLRSSSASPTPLCRSAELPRPLLPPLPPLLTAPPLNRLSTAASPMDNSRGGGVAGALLISTSYRPSDDAASVGGVGGARGGAGGCGRSPSVTSPMSGRRPSPLTGLKAVSGGKDEEERKEAESRADAQLRAKRERGKKRQTMPEKSPLRDLHHSMQHPQQQQQQHTTQP